MAAQVIARTRADGTTVITESLTHPVTFLNRIVSDNEEGHSYSFLIFSRSSRAAVGIVGGAIEKHRMQFGYCLARDAWGREFATEGACAFVAAALEISGLWRIQAFCDVENCASARVLEKIGLEREGTLRRHMVLPNMGEAPRDVHCYAKIRVAAGAVET